MITNVTSEILKCDVYVLEEMHKIDHPGKIISQAMKRAKFCFFLSKSK